MFKHLKNDIFCIFDRDPAAQSVFEVVTCYPGFHAMLFYRLSHWLWKQNFKWLGRYLSHWGRWLTGIEIHPGAQIGQRFFIDHGMGVVIGETAIIGDDCTLYHGVTLGGTSWKKGKRHPTLGDGVVVGAGAKVLGPIEIGAGARIGSNSVVLKNVPAGTTVVGIPGHVVGSKEQKTNLKLDAINAKTDFDPYGTKADMPDPIAQAINHMLDHIQQMDKQVECLKQALNAAGIDCKSQAIPQLNGFEISDGQTDED